MPAPRTSPESKASIHLFGDVFAADFPDWIVRHAQKLGLHSLSATRQKECLHVAATGPEDMLDALVLGCSLGPATVMVERIDYKSKTIA